MTSQATQTQRQLTRRRHSKKIIINKKEKEKKTACGGTRSCVEKKGHLLERGSRKDEEWHS